MQLLDVETAAARLSLHPETVRRLIRAGDIRALKTGRLWKVEETEIGAYVARLKAAQDDG
jgi:excisionase family DNA binding protein